MPLSKKKQKRAVKVKKLGKGIDGWGLVLPDGVQPKYLVPGIYLKELIDDVDRVIARHKEGDVPNCPDGRYRDKDGR